MRPQVAPVAAVVAVEAATRMVLMVSARGWMVSVCSSVLLVFMCVAGSQAKFSGKYCSGSVVSSLCRGQAKCEPTRARLPTRASTTVCYVMFNDESNTPTQVGDTDVCHNVEFHLLSARLHRSEMSMFKAGGRDPLGIAR